MTVRLGPGQAHHRSQHGMGTDLHDHVHTRFGQRCDCLPEGHGLTGLGPPVGAVERPAGLHDAARQGADEVDGRTREGNVGDRDLHTVQCGFHQRAVIRGASPQAPHPHVFGFEARQHRLDLGCRTAHRLVRPVVGGDAHAGPRERRVVLLDSRRHAGRTGEDRSHRAIHRQIGHQRSPRRRETQALLQPEHPGGLRGCDLAKTVPHDNVRSDPHALPQRRQSALQRVDGRLRPRRMVQISRRVATPEHRVQERVAARLAVCRLAPIHNGTRHGLGLVELPPHPDPLAGLAGVRKRDLRFFPGGFGASLGLSLRKRPQGSAQ